MFLRKRRSDKQASVRSEPKESHKPLASGSRRQPTGNFLEDALLGLDISNRPARPPGPTVQERWSGFKGNDSPASVMFGCASVITTVILAMATVVVALRANDLLDRQNDLILAGSLPVISASLLPTANGGYTLAVENSGPRANFRSIEPMTLLRFSFEKYDEDMESGYVALYDVFPPVEPNEAGVGTLATVSSVPGVSSRVEEICRTITGADSRVKQCGLEVSMTLRYQTNTDEVHRSYYRFDDEVSLQVSAGELQRQVNRWNNGPDDKFAFSIGTKPPENLAEATSGYVAERADPPPEFGF